MTDPKGTQDGAGGGTEGGATTDTPVVFTKEDAEKLFGEKLDAAQRHFQGVAQRQANTFRAEKEEMERRAESAEAQLTAVQDRYFEGLDAEAQVKILRQELTARNKPAPKSQAPADTVGIADVIAEVFKAQDIDPKDPDLDWATDETDVMAAAKRLGASVTKKQATRISAAVDAKAEQIKADLTKLVEAKYEVGDHANVDLGGVRSGASGKKHTRQNIVDMSIEEYEREVLGKKDA